MTVAQKNVKGVLGEKLGMTQVWDADNKLVPVTVVKAGPCVVTQVRADETDGYSAVQIAFGAIDPRKVNKPMSGHFEKAGVTPRRHLVELRTADAAAYELGQEITAESFEAGQRVDATGTTKGKGFAGVMKRHGFHGVSSSHGAHRNHRKPGSIGGCSTPGRVFKGMRMAGRMGVVHGPQPRDYSQRTPKKMKAAALRGALSDRARFDRIHVVDSIVSGELPSAKDAAAVLAGLTERPNLLVVIERGDDIAMKSVRNLQNVHVLVADQLNTYDVLCADDIVFTQAALDAFVAGPVKADKADKEATK